MSKQNRTALEKIQTLRSGELAKILFKDYQTRGTATRIIYKDAYNQVKEKNKQGFVMPHIRDCFKEWEELGFIEKSPEKIPFMVNKPNIKPYPLKNYGYRLTLKPFYEYCKNRNVEFTKEEKDFLESNEPNSIQLQWNRKKILEEFPEDNIIEAIIKFYIKHFTMPNIEVLDRKNKEIWEMMQNHIEEELKRGELLKKGLLKKRRKPSVLRDYFDKLKNRKLSLEERKEWSETFSNLFSYVLNFKKNPKLITSINKKFKQALGII